MRLSEIRTSRGFSQQKLADKIGVSRSTVAMWETSKSEPDNEMLCVLAKILNTTVDYILGNETEKPINKGIKIPVLGKVIAGIPIEAVEEILDYEEITQDMARQGEHFGLQIKGNSMEPRMVEGDVVIVRKQSDVDSGDIAIILVNGNEATVKKIRKREDGIELIPSNHSYDIAFYSNKQIEELPVTIVGKIVELRAKF